MRILIASDKFKEALSAEAACGALRRGVLEAAPEAEVDVCPMADGGEGTARALAAGYPEEDVDRRTYTVCGPMPDMRVEAAVLIVEDGMTALIDMAEASGLMHVPPERRNPLFATSFGVGELIRHAADAGCRRIIVGLGGSATCDGGFGAAQALGLVLELDEGPLDRPVTARDLGRLRHVEVPTVGLRARVTCLCDVDNPLVGPRGTARMFAPQKGASPADVEVLEANLRHAATVVARREAADEPFMGAAGGLAFGLALACKAEPRPGVAAVAECARLALRLEGTRLCITGEGRLDAGSLGGKVVAGVAELCRDAEVACVALVGSFDPAAADATGVTSVFSLATGPGTLQRQIVQTEERLEHAALQVTRLVLASRPPD